MTDGRLAAGRPQLHSVMPTAILRPARLNPPRDNDKWAARVPGKLDGPLYHARCAVIFHCKSITYAKLDPCRAPFRDPATMPRSYAAERTGLSAGSLLELAGRSSVLPDVHTSDFTMIDADTLERAGQQRIGGTCA